MQELKMGPFNDTEDLSYIRETWKLEDRNGQLQFTGRLLGAGSSRREQHSHNTNTQIVVTARAVGKTDAMQRCAACRWSEIYVFKTDTQFIVYTLGPSIIPGEHTRAKVSYASSAFEVVELATVRHGQRSQPFLPAAHARALAMAAADDDDIADAYVNRAVA